MCDYLSWDTARCDAFALQHIDSKWLAGENELFLTKWWDYRFYHPLKASVVFADAYIWATKEAIKRRYSIYKGANAAVLKHPDLFQNPKTTITGIWKARREADRHGVPYDLWCIWGMDYAEERDWQYLPKAYQLYSEKALEGDLSIVEYITARWADAKHERRCYSTADLYQTQNYRAHPYQRAHQKVLAERIGRSPYPAIDVATLYYQEQVLLEDTVKAVFAQRAMGIMREASKFAFN